MDTADHVWIDHNRFTHMGDGLLDIRKDSQYVTVSYNQFSNHNKAFGIGWTTNVKTQITIDHNWFTGTKQRNPSADNCAYAHLYNNYLSAQVADGDPVWTYGNWSRGSTKMVIENSYYDGVQHPYQADATAELVRARVDPAEHHGPDRRVGCRLRSAGVLRLPAGPGRRRPRAGEAVLRTAGADRRRPSHVPADYPTVQAAVDAVPDGNDVPVTIAVAPGTYRAKVLIPASKPNIVLRGTGHDRSDTVIVFDTPAEYGGSPGAPPSGSPRMTSPPATSPSATTSTRPRTS